MTNLYTAWAISSCSHIPSFIHIELIVMLTSSEVSTWHNLLAPWPAVCSEPWTICKGNEKSSLPAKPLPISNPLLAGIESIALESSASSLSNTGEPSPYKMVLPDHISYHSSVSSFWKKRIIKLQTYFQMKPWQSWLANGQCIHDENYQNLSLNAYTRNISCNACDHPANGIPSNSYFVNCSYHLICILWIRTSNNVALDLENYKFGIKISKWPLGLSW